MALWSPSGPQYVEPGGVFWRSKLVLGPEGIPSRAAVGAPTLIYNERIQLNGIPSRAAVGHPSLIYTQGLSATGIASRKAVGSPRILLASELLATGIPSRKAVGSPRIDMHLAAAGITSRKAIGAPTLTLGPAPNVLYDVTGTAYTSISSVSSVSGSGTLVVNSGDAVIIWTSVDTNSTKKASSYTRTATYGGQPMTSLGAIDANNGTHGWLEGFILLDAPGGTQSWLWSVTGTSTTFYCSIAEPVAYSNASSYGTPIINFGTANMSSGAVASVSGQIVVQAFYDQNIGSVATGITSYNQTSRYSNTIHNGSSAYLSMLAGDAPGATSVNFSATNSNSNLSWASIAVPLIP